MKRHAPRRHVLVVRAPDGSEAKSPFYTGMEHPVCAWDDCQMPAREESHLIEPDHEKKANVWFYFCSDFHKVLHSASHRTYSRVEPERRTSPFL